MEEIVLTPTDSQIRDGSAAAQARRKQLDGLLWHGQCRFQEQIMKQKFFNANYPTVPKYGYLYIVQADQYISKIGITSGCPKQRAKEISHGCWIETRLRYVCLCYGYNHFEKILHGLFKDFQMRGEWFSLSPEEIFNASYHHQHGIDWDLFENDKDYILPLIQQRRAA